MSPRPVPAPTHRLLPRAWVRLASASAAACGACVIVVAVLLEGDEAKPSRVHVADDPRPPVSARTTETPAPTAAPLAPPRATPTTLAGVFREDRTTSSDELATWVEDARLDAQVRYGALRRLEREDPARAVGASIAVLSDVTPLVRLNAIAVLARARDPRATAALEGLDDRSRRMASQLARR